LFPGEPSDALAAQEEKKAQLAAKKAARAAKKGGDEEGTATPSGSTADLASLSLDEKGSSADLTAAGAAAHEVQDKNAILRTVTGVLTSRPTSRDIKIDGFSMGLNGVPLIQDCSIELTIGRRCAAPEAAPPCRPRSSCAHTAAAPLATGCWGKTDAARRTSCSASRRARCACVCWGCLRRG